MANSGINLLQTKSDFNPLFALVKRYIVWVSMGMIGIVLVSGIGISLAFFYLQSQRETFLVTEKRLSTEIESQSVKEALLTGVASRLTAIEKILAEQHSYVPYIDTTLKIIKTYTLSSFALGENHSMSIGITVSTLEEAVDVFTTVMSMEHMHMIHSPILESFSMKESGIFDIKISYIVIL